jgi:disulfide bond formation protein DsbB
MKITKLLAVALVAVALLGGACGGGDDGGSESSDSGGEASAGAGDVGAGEEVYSGTCATCHGDDGEGIDGLGLPIVGSEFVAATSEPDLADFIAAGRSVSDPDNTTGVDMPPKGGNPSLTEQDLADVAAYTKSIN